jgi:hypothetical protein
MIVGAMITAVAIVAANLVLDEIRQRKNENQTVGKN